MRSLPTTPFTCSDLPRLDLSRKQLRALVERGEVRRVLHGTYVVADVPDSLTLRAQAAALALPEHAVLCDRSAAWLWGVDRFDPVEHEFPARLETVSADGHDRVRRRGVYAGKRDLLPAEVCEVGGVRVTTPLRTACDLACLRGRRSALAVYDAFARHHGLYATDYERMLRRFVGRRGVKQARELAPYAIAGAESPGESWSRMDVIDAGLRPPEAQVWVDVPGFGLVRLDLAYLGLRIAVEYDGEEHHTSPADRERDQRRRDALRAAGWIVIVVTKADFSSGASGEWLVELKAAIRDRVPAYTRSYSRGESWDPRRR